MPVPHCHAVVVKLASRCNLNCSYCYIYNMGDSSYAAQPALMSAGTATALIDRAAAHCVSHKLEHFSFVFHGGEPLLAPSRLFERFVATAADRFSGVCPVSFAVQTNGTLLSSEICRLFARLNIHVGLSLDGARETHDARRKYHSGAGSYDDVLRGWKFAVEAGLKPGILSVVDVDADPKSSFRHLTLFRPNAVDFLLPDANHEKLPPRSTSTDSRTPYADWLIAIFEEWVSCERPPFRIKLFEAIITACLGEAVDSEGVGQRLNEILVVECDGSIGPTDVLKICGESITEHNVHSASFDEALAHPLIALYQNSNQELCPDCNACRIHHVCGGGQLPHRYRTKNGFANPSVYCADLLKLIDHIQAWVGGQLQLSESVGLSPLNPD
jgi:uncharacterized protein